MMMNWEQRSFKFSKIDRGDKYLVHLCSHVHDAFAHSHFLCRLFRLTHCRPIQYLQTKAMALFHCRLVVKKWD